MAKSNRAAALLNLIQKAPTDLSGVQNNSTSAESESPTRNTRAGSPGYPEPYTSGIVGRTGKRTQVFLHEADRRIIRELVAYFAGQGRRVSESLVIKAALRTAKPGDELLRAYEQAASQDQRFKDHTVKTVKTV